MSPKTPSKSTKSPISKRPSPASASGSGTKAKRGKRSSPAADAPGTIPSLFAQRRTTDTPPPPEPEEEEPLFSEPPTPMAAAAANSPATADASTAFVPLTAKEEELLRSFDLIQKFGPCVGPTRLERWNRANRWSLDPPKDVKALLDSLPEQHPGHQALWYNKNL